MQELKVVQKIGHRQRSFRPVSTLPASVPAWRNVGRTSRRSQVRIQRLPFSLRLPRVFTPWELPSPRRLATMAVSVAVGIVAAAALAYLLTAARDFFVSIPQIRNDPLARRSMMGYVGLPSVTAPSTTVEAGDGALLDTVETFSWDSYTVKSGDSVSSIAASRSLSIDSIIALNALTNVKRLRAGVTIKIPNMDGIPYAVRKGDSLGRIATSWGVPVEAILDANDLSTDTITIGQVLFLPGARMRGEELKRALGELFIYPIRGALTSTFGWRNDPFTGARRFHAAIDLAARIGTPVKAAMDGRISAVGVSSVYGNYVIVTHSGGYQTMYAHLNVVRTAKGRRVVQGERIGDVGTTGYSTGPHLHFAVYRNGRAVNPLQFLSR